MIVFKRGKGKYNTDYSSDDIYKFYVKSSKHPVDKSLYMRILKDMYGEFIKMCIFENVELILPASLGKLRIQKKKVNIYVDKEGNLVKPILPPDWKKTKELWEKKYGKLSPEEYDKIEDKPVVPLINEHSDGYRYRWFWDKITSKVLNQSVYHLRMTRTYKTMLAKAIKTVKGLNFYK